MKRSEHLAGFSLGLVLVILGGRALAYAATPTPLAAQLGGPRLPVITFVALALAAVISLGVLWLAALGVRERHALDRAPGPRRASRWRGSPRTPHCSRAARCSASPRSRPGCTRAPACTCTGGCASRGRCTATRFRS